MLDDLDRLGPVLVMGAVAVLILLWDLLPAGRGGPAARGRAWIPPPLPPGLPPRRCPPVAGLRAPLLRPSGRVLLSAPLLHRRDDAPGLQPRPDPHLRGAGADGDQPVHHGGAAPRRTLRRSRDLVTA